GPGEGRERGQDVLGGAPIAGPLLRIVHQGAELEEPRGGRRGSGGVALRERVLPWLRSAGAVVRTGGLAQGGVEVGGWHEVATDVVVRVGVVVGGQMGQEVVGGAPGRVEEAFRVHRGIVFREAVDHGEAVERPRLPARPGALGCVPLVGNLVVHGAVGRRSTRAVVVLDDVVRTAVGANVLLHRGDRR